MSPGVSGRAVAQRTGVPAPLEVPQARRTSQPAFYFSKHSGGAAVSCQFGVSGNPKLAGPSPGS